MGIIFIHNIYLMLIIEKNKKRPESTIFWITDDIFTANKFEKLIRDSNSQPLDHQSPLVTNRPGLPPPISVYQVYCCRRCCCRCCCCCWLMATAILCAILYLSDIRGGDASSKTINFKIVISQSFKFRTPKTFFNKKCGNTGLIFLFIFVVSTSQFNYKLKEAWMLSMGFEPGSTER